MTHNTEILSKIRKLLNLGTNDAAALGEAENAMRFARRLMLRHNISEGDVKPQDVHERAADADSVEYGHTETYSSGGKLAGWECALAWAVVECVGTIKWFRRTGVIRKIDGIAQLTRSGDSQRAGQIVFYGPVEDCADAAELLAEWQVTIAAMARLRFGGVFRGPGRSYCEGFASALHEKMLAIQREERARIRAVATAQRKTGELEVGDRTYALVTQNALQLMAAKRERAVSYCVKTLKLKLTKGRRSSGGHHHGEAYGMGRSDGRASNMTRATRRKLS